jgi:hypothetical protein
MRGLSRLNKEGYLALFTSDFCGFYFHWTSIIICIIWSSYCGVFKFKQSRWPFTKWCNRFDYNFVGRYQLIIEDNRLNNLDLYVWYFCTSPEKGE